MRFVGNQSFAEFHNTDRVRRYAVIGEDEFGNPEIAAANNSPYRKMFFVWLNGSALLNVVPAADSFARLRIVEHSIIAVDFMLDLEIARVGGNPMALQRRTHGLIIHLDLPLPFGTMAALANMAKQANPQYSGIGTPNGSGARNEVFFIVRLRDRSTCNGVGALTQEDIMRSIFMKGALVGAALAFGTSAFAADDWDLNHREQWLQERVDRGLQDGSLDADEAKHVRQDLEQIHSEQVRLQDASGGELTASDSDRLEEHLDHVARQIRWLKHEDDDTPPWPSM